MPKVIRKYPTIKKCLTCLEILLYKNKLGNKNNDMSFELNEPIYEGKFFNSNKKFYIVGYDYDPYQKIHVEYINSESISSILVLELFSIFRVISTFSLYLTLFNITSLSLIYLVNLLIDNK